MSRLSRQMLVLLLVVLLGCNNNSSSSGDRVLVAKYLYDSEIGTRPSRFDVVVFKYPEHPIQRGTPTNYIKRLLGLAGETLAIFFGQLFYTTELAYPHDSEQEPNARELWKTQWTHANEPRSLDLFKKGSFRIIQKSPDVMLALQRIVYDNDHHAKDLKDVLPPRWHGDGAWQVDGTSFAHAGGAEKAEWLRYRHYVRPEDWPSPVHPQAAAIIESIKRREHQPQLITDFSGYNSYRLPDPHNPNKPGIKDQPPNWVGNLLLECKLTVRESKGEFWLELSKSGDRFQARWSLANGECKLVRLQDGAAEEVLSTRPTTLSAAGQYHVRFANVDERLTVWVDRTMPFDEGATYPRAWRFDREKGGFTNLGPTANDLQPASFASKGAAVQVQQIKLYRDTYYAAKLLRDQGPDAEIPSFNEESNKLARDDIVGRAASIAQEQSRFWSKPERWAPLRKLQPVTMYVQPGHYLCLGDNSPESSDGRSWGLVPERLMLGRALVVYYPFHRAGLIR